MSIESLAQMTKN